MHKIQHLAYFGREQKTVNAQYWRTSTFNTHHINAAMIDRLFFYTYRSLDVNQTENVIGDYTPR